MSPMYTSPHPIQANLPPSFPADPHPQSDEAPFQVKLSDECFETYELDPPSYTLDTTKAELKQMYNDMVTVRRMEMAADRLYKEKKIRGFCH
ncbi:alpha subunit of pyruvate dehydrogenase, partial [Teratosphaeriaceae sp. CCFEE 6253]